MPGNLLKAAKHLNRKMKVQRLFRKEVHYKRNGNGAPLIGNAKGEDIVLKTHINKSVKYIEMKSLVQLLTSPVRTMLTISQTRHILKM